jgi:MarR family transcriptional regulator, organic hydroperoxide resistance regulator
MPRSFSSTDEADLVRAEKDIQARAGNLAIDFGAAGVVSNVYRVATAIRYHMEAGLLAEYGLSWTAFVSLFVLWVWGPLESRQLAQEVGITKGTLTGVVKTLERRGLCTRESHPSDGRLVVVRPTDTGVAAIEELYPIFNEQEAAVTAALSERERTMLAHGLRKMLRTLEVLDASNAGGS